MKWQRSKMNIGQKVRGLVLVCSTLTFLALSSIGLYGMYYNQKTVVEQGTASGDISADYTEAVVKELSLTTLSTVAKGRAAQLNRELIINAEDAMVLSSAMTEILTHPERHMERNLADPRRDKIHSGEVYLWLSPSLEDAMTPELKHEIGIASNIEDSLFSMAKSYGDYRTSCFLASEDGYFICVDVDPEHEIIEGFEDQMEGFDPRERPWYILPPEGEDYTFSEIFVGVEGFPSITAVTPYYDKNGFAGIVGVDASLSSIQKLVMETGVGHTGFSIALDGDGNVVFSPKASGALAPSQDVDLRQLEEETLAHAAREMTAGETGVLPVSFDGEEYYLAYAPMPAIGWSFGTLIDKKEIAEPAAASRQVILEQTGEFIGDMRGNFYRMLIVTVLILALLFVVISALSSRLVGRFTKPIKALAEGVQEISGGNLGRKLDIRTGDELEHLADSFNTMTDELKTYMENLTRVTVEREREQAEMNIAAGIQKGLLPRSFPERKDIALYASMCPAKNVGGDFYDFYFLDEHHLVITMADVSGKGVGAAIFMSRSMTILKNLATMMKDPDDLAGVLFCANNQLCHGNEEDMFVTVFMGMLDTRTGEFTYANGGHNPPLLRWGADGTFGYLTENGSCMLGLKEDVPFVQQSMKLEPGSMIFLYTDGVTEAMNEKRELFSENRLLETLSQVPSQASPEEVLSTVEKAVHTHANSAEQFDDITMLGLRFIGE
ncbi:MAG: SpoIIE family protein phosphatase [Selenomonadaceae bacterium]|nr:SpoIIE family protein phosphatase [Selenomonadaceae bacterium]